MDQLLSTTLCSFLISLPFLYYTFLRSSTLCNVWRDSSLMLSGSSWILILANEALTHGNTFALCKRNFPIVGGHGEKWEMETDDTTWFLVGYLDTTASKSLLMKSSKKPEKWQILVSGETQLLGHFFPRDCLLGQI